MIEAQPVVPDARVATPDAVKLIQEAHAAGNPNVLTINNRVELAICDAQSRQMLIDLVDRVETIAAIERGIASVDCGECQPAGEVVAQLRSQAATEHGSRSYSRG